MLASSPPTLPPDYQVRASPRAVIPPGEERFAGVLLKAALEAVLATTPASQATTLARFLARLNQHLANPADHFTPKNLPHHGQFFGIEFSTVFLAVCLEMSGNPHLLADTVRTAAPLQWVLASIPQVADRYQWVVHYATSPLGTHLRIDRLGPRHVAVHWAGATHRLPAPLQPLAVYQAESILAAALECVPIVSGLPPAQVTVAQARSAGAERTTWHVRWEEWPATPGVWLWAVGGLALSVALLALAGQFPALWAVALIPVVVGVLSMRLFQLYAYRRRLVSYHHHQRQAAQAVLAELETVNQRLNYDNTELHQKVAELSALQDISATLSQVLSLEEVIGQSLAAIVRHLGFDQAALFLLDDSRQHLLPGYLCGGPPALAADLAQFTMPVRDADTPNRRHWLHGESFWVHHPDEVHNSHLRQLMIRHNLREYIGVPLITHGEVIGLLSVHNGLTNRPLSAYSVQALQTVGVQLANAIQAQRVYQSLEARVQARTLELQEALTQAEQARRTAEDLRAVAERATASKTEFLATMSHEIRNPLNGVMGATELLIRTGLTPNQHELVEKLMQSGLALRAVVNNVLDFSKIEAGHMELRPEPFRVHECVESALDVVAPLAVHHALELAYVISPGTPHAMLGDASRVRQILINLLSNAVKLTTQGEVVVLVRLAEAPPHQPPLWQFSVRDTGPGLTTEQQERLFTQYIQVNHQSTSGTGLGLVISRNLAELMGGQLWVESSGVPGQGAAFHFTVRAPLAGTALLPSTPPWHDKRVGVLHLHPPTRQQINYWLNQWGAHALPNPQPSQALDALVCDARQAAALTPWGAACPPVVWVFAQATHLPAEASWRLSQPIKAEALRAALAGALGLTKTPMSIPATTPNRQLMTVRLLLVEDNPVNQNLMLRMLQSLGYAPDVAANGREAVTAISHTHYDLVLMDVQMPEMDGVEATRLIRRDLPAARQPRIVALTANAVAAERERCLQAGMDDFLSKPISLNDLRQALERHHPPRPAEPPPPATPSSALTKLRDLVEDIGSDNVRLIVDLYMVDTPQQVHDMQTAPPERLKALAHRLRGSSAQVGATALADLCFQIEANPAAAAPVLAQLSASLAATLDDLRRALAEL